MGPRSCFGTIFCAEINFSLNSIFLKFFAYDGAIEATVEEVISWNDKQNHWHIAFMRSPNDWEEEGVLSLLALLVNTKVGFKGDDEILSPYVSSGQFTAKSYCKEMYEGWTQLDFLVEAIWMSKAANKACFLPWATTKGRILIERFLALPCKEKLQVG